MNYIPFLFFIPYFIFIGVLLYFQGIPLNNHYYLRTSSNPEEIVEQIKAFLKETGMEYKLDRFIREYLFKWYTVIDIHQPDIRIKIFKLRFQQWKTNIIIGRRTEHNKKIVINFVNDIAKWLKCENFRPIKT